MNTRKDVRARVFHSFADEARAERDYWKSLSPSERLDMMWQLAIDAWSFTGDRSAESRLPRLLSAFIENNVEFLVVGGYAMAAHRLPRATKDLDLWVRPSAENAEHVLQALDAFGAPRHGLTAADLEKSGTIYQVGVPPNRVDVITTVDGVEFENAWKDRAEIDVDGIRIPVISRIHLIANKRSVGRPQDLLDADLLESE
jgi:hypothetical protein